MYAWHRFSTDAGQQLDRIGDDLSIVDAAMGNAIGIVAYGLHAFFGTIAMKIATFVKNNWQQLLAYTIAWGIIVTCTGVLYSFEAVALPLTIGMAGGVGGGIISGIFMVKLDPVGRLSLWNLIDNFITWIDINGTRPIINAVAVTVLLAAAVVYPYVIGAIFGLFIGNQLTVKAGTNQNLGPSPHAVDAERQQYQLALKSHEEAIASYQQAFKTELGTLQTQCDQKIKELLARQDLLQQHRAEIANLKNTLHAQADALKLKFDQDMNKLLQEQWNLKWKESTLTHKPPQINQNAISQAGENLV